MRGPASAGTREYLRDPLCSPRFMPDDVILTWDIDNAGHAPGEHNKWCPPHLQRRKKKRRKGFHSLALALTLTLPVTLSPNHSATKHCWRIPALHRRLMCTALMHLPILLPLQLALHVQGRRQTSAWRHRAWSAVNKVNTEYLQRASLVARAVAGP